MVRVCEDTIPLEFVRKQKPKAKYPGFDLHPVLKEQIDIYLKNVNKDWDFVIIICGEGETRVGKSFFASQIGKYWTDQIKKLYGKEVPFDLKTNFVFKGEELIKRGNFLGVTYPFSCLIFDEAGADLEGIKAMRRTTQNAKDYLRECGQYNMLTVLVLPEFFDLPKGIALNRSHCMINVYWMGDEEGYMNRGYFKYYSRPNKKQVYIRGKKNLDYNVWGYDFYGSFDNLFTMDLEEYKQLKKKALKKREVESAKVIRWKEWLRACLVLLTKTYGNSHRELADKIKDVGKISINYTWIGKLIGREEVEDDN
ncbi:MAG TPA: hypothetical protein VMV95_00185 [Bacillota bacterium]|nr:hypothetical protein [Bacillota bacterium]